MAETPFVYLCIMRDGNTRHRQGNFLLVDKTNKRAFGVLWAGQSVSLLGTAMTRFAVLLWAYQQAGTATALALLGFFVTTAFVVASPIAGVLVDRWDRRKVMAFADLGAGCMTALLLLLYLQGGLRIWHLYLAQGVAGALEAFQDPAFSASVSLLVPKERYTPANSLLGLGRSASRIFAPALAGVLMQTGGLEWVMAVDLGTLALALIGLLCIRIPAPPRSIEGAAATGKLGRELRFGFGYIFHRPGLRGVLLIFFLINVFATLTYFGVMAPMILARTGGDAVGLGVVQAVMGVGGVVGDGAGLWGGPAQSAALSLSTSLVPDLRLLMGVSPRWRAGPLRISLRLRYSVHRQPVLRAVAGSRPAGCARPRLLHPRDGAGDGATVRVSRCRVSGRPGVRASDASGRRARGFVGLAGGDGTGRRHGGDVPLYQSGRHVDRAVGMALAGDSQIG